MCNISLYAYESYIRASHWVRANHPCAYSFICTTVVAFDPLPDPLHNPISAPIGIIQMEMSVKRIPNASAQSGYSRFSVEYCNEIDRYIAIIAVHS